MNPPDLLFRQVHALASPGAALGCDRFFSAPLRALSLTGLSSATSSSHRILVLKIPGPAKVPTKRLEHQGVVQAARTADGPVLEGAEASGVIRGLFLGLAALIYGVLQYHYRNRAARQAGGEILKERYRKG